MGMEIEHNNKWVCMEKTGDNYFSINGVGEMQLPKRFRLTSISGEQLSGEHTPISIQVRNIPTVLTKFWQIQPTLFQRTSLY